MHTGDTPRRAPAIPSSATGLEIDTLGTEPRSRSNVEIALDGTCIRQYELIRELGHGGMGVVYAARDTRLGRRVAIKFLRDASRDVQQRFLVEARATAMCNHENIVVIHEVDEHDGTPYMVLEFLEGRTFRDVLEQEAPVPASRAIELALPIARALARAHAAGIVHRDLKPENVFVTRAGQVKVLDFGIAKALDGGWDHPTGVPISARDVDTDRFAGTPPYMSPEQMGLDEVDHRTDLWSLGILLFELLSGHHPVQPPTVQELINNAASDAPMPSIQTVVPDLPEALVQLVDACLRKPKDERVPNALVLADSLEQLSLGRRRGSIEAVIPYPGLIAFQEADADRFFGRSRDIDRMVASIHERPLTGVIGPSGAGKSSFVRAGVGPALKRAGRWEIVAIRPGRHPMTTLADVALQLTSTAKPTNADRQTLRKKIVQEPGHFGALLRQRARNVDGRVVLFVDQFEELYTLTAEPEKRALFLAALAGVADYASAPLRVTVSVRSDFLDRVAENTRFMEELAGGLMFLGLPDRDELREALVAPLETTGYRFENGEMVDAMVNALADTPSALPLLQFTASKLWETRDEARRVLTAASFSAIGGISGALASHADDVVARMDSRSRDLTRRLFRALVTPERTRAIVERPDLEHLGARPSELDRVLDDLVAARLLVVQTREEGDASIEIVHESLIARWPTLARWLDEDQEDAAFVAQVAAAAKPWDAQQRPQGLLWRGDVIEDAMRRDRARPQQLAGRERAFLDAGFAHARRSTRLRRLAILGTIVLLSVGVGIVSVFYFDARKARDEATAARDEATSTLRELAAANAKALEANRDLDRSEADLRVARDDAAIAKATAARQSALATREQVDTELRVVLSRIAAQDPHTAALEAARARVIDVQQRAEAAKQTALANADADKRALAKAKADLDRQAVTAKEALVQKMAAEIEAARNASTADERLKALDRLTEEVRRQDELAAAVRIAADDARDKLNRANTKLNQANAKLQAQLDDANQKRAKLEAEIKNLKLSTELKGLKK